MRSDSLAWRLLPPVGGEPSNVISQKSHLTYRCGPTLVAVGDRVLLWGGKDSFGNPLPSAQGLTISEGRVTDRWEVDWSWGDSAALVNSQVVVVGPGSDRVERALVFAPGDPEHAQQFVSPIKGRLGVSPIAVDRRIVLWGGTANDRLRNRNLPPFADGAVFEATTRTWAVLPEAPLCGRKGHVLQSVGDQVVVWGGWTWKGPRDVWSLADGAVYDLGRGEWRPMPPSPLSARADMSSAAVEGRVFIWGGSGDRNTRYPADGALFDPRSDTWTLIPASPVRKPGASAFVLDDLVLLTGGTSTGGRDVSMLVYSILSDSWDTPHLPGFVPGLASFAKLGNGEIYVWSAFDSRTEHAVLQSIATPESHVRPTD